MTRLSLILIVSLVLTALSSHGQIGKTISFLPSTDTIEVQVKLIDKVDSIQLFPYCGVHVVHMTLKYQVIKVISGNYKDTTILINHICLREMIENKEVRNNGLYIYKLKLRQTFGKVLVGQQLKRVVSSEFEIISSF